MHDIFREKFNFSQNEILNKYQITVFNSLRIEYNFLVQVARDYENPREDVYTQHIQIASKLLGSAVSSFLPFANVGQVITLLGTLYAASSQIRNRSMVKSYILEYFMSEYSFGGAPSKIEYIFDMVAREATYRYGASIVELFSSSPDKQNIIDICARVAAFRILYYAIENKVLLTDHLHLMNGLYIGINHRRVGTTESKLCKIGELVYTVDGLYSNCAFVTPSDTMVAPVSVELPSAVQAYAIEDDFSNTVVADAQALGSLAVATSHAHSARVYPEQSPRGLITGAAHFINHVAETILTSFYEDANKQKLNFYVDAKSATYMFSSPPPGTVSYTTTEQGSQLYPQYGYAQLPSIELMQTYDFKIFNPQTNDRFLPHIYNFQCMYISSSMIVEYLLAIKHNQCRPTTSLSQWLSEKFSHENTYIIYPVFRGILDGDELKRSYRVDLSTGIFDYGDYSYSTIKNAEIKSMQGSLLIGTKLYNITMKNTLHNSSLALAYMQGCSLTDIEGHVELDFSGGTETTVLAKSIAHPTRVFDFDKTCTVKEQSNLVAGQILAPNDVSNFALRDVQYMMENQYKMYRAEQADLAAIEKIKNEALEKARAESEERLNALEAQIAAQKKADDEVKPSYYPGMAAVDSKTLGELEKYMSYLKSSTDRAVGNIYDTLFFSGAKATLRQLNGQKIAWCDLKRKIIIDYSGTHGAHGHAGQNGANGSYGGGSGGNGLRGGDGQSGTDAQSIKMSLMSVPHQNFFLTTEDHRNEAIIAPLFEQHVSISVLANGSDGGKGGNGGKGGDGGDGRPGIDATRSSAGTSGTNGGNGGNGGDSGSGGHAGQSGNIDIYVREHDMDLLSVIELVQCHKGTGGTAGNYGLLGSGGKGGRGGSSCTYTETTSYTKSDGSQGYNHITRTNPGGHDGADGQNGHYGSTGKDGQSTKDGVYAFHVIPSTADGEVNRYGSIYQVQLTGLSAIQSPSGVLEPGQNISIASVVVKNIGEMPTPMSGISLINVYVDENNIFVSDTKIRGLNETIYHNTEKAFELDIPLHMKSQETPAIGTILDLKTQLILKATCPRITKPLKNFHLPQYPTVKVEFPLELSIIRGSRTIIPGKEIPIVFKVRNKTRLAFGIDSLENKRLVKISLDIGSNYNANPILRPKQAQHAFGMSAPVLYDVRYIAPGSTIEIPGTFMIPNNAMRAYTHIRMKASLSITGLYSPLDIGSMQIVQQEIHPIQIAEEATLPTSPNILLVVNSSTTEVIVNHWKQIANEANKIVSIWNVSHYRGVSYKNTSFDFTTIAKDGVVVFLNTIFSREEAVEVNESYYADYYLAAATMFEAARKSGVRTYVIDQSDHLFSKKAEPGFTWPQVNAWDSPQQFVSHQSSNTKLNDQYIEPVSDVMKISMNKFFSKPTEKEFVSKFNSILDDLSKKHPNRRYHAYFSFDLQMGSGCCLKTYACGKVQINRGLDRIGSMLAIRAVKDDTIISEADRYLFVKLLKFEEKLDLFCTIEPTSRMYKVVEQMILSDLADEQRVYRGHARKHKYTADKLQQDLNLLKIFVSYNFNQLFRHIEGKKSLLEIVIKLGHLLNLYKYSILMSNKYFNKIGYKLLDTLLKRHFPTMTSSQYQGKIREYVTSLKAPLESKSDDYIEYLQCKKQLSNIDCVLNNDVQFIPQSMNTQGENQHDYLPPETNITEKFGLFSQLSVFRKNLPELYPSPDEAVNPQNSTENTVMIHGMICE